jgi:hypothetical protein
LRELLRKLLRKVDAQIVYDLVLRFICIPYRILIPSMATEKISIAILLICKRFVMP